MHSEEACVEKGKALVRNEPERDGIEVNLWYKIEFLGSGWKGARDGGWEVGSTCQ